MNVDRPRINSISLFSGVGTLDEGFHAGLEFLGIRSRTILFAEREAYPVSVLVTRMEEGSLSPAPIWFGDLCELNARQFRGVVDCVVAGFPCQDISIAGRRAGLDGKRSGLFFEILRIADDCGAWLIALENVSAIATATASVVDEAEGELDERAAARVLGELADRGWNAEWLTLSASDVGASHGRERWFAIAWRGVGNARLQREYLQQRADGTKHPPAIESMDDAARLDGVEWQRHWVSTAPGPGAEPRTQGSGDNMGHASGDGRGQGRTECTGQSGRSDPIGSSLQLADAISAGWGHETWPDVPEHGGMEKQGCAGRGECSGNAVGRSEIVGFQLADTSQPGLEKRECLGGVRREALCALPWETAFGGSDPLLFAPGPSDSRWAEIIADSPFLAPAIAAGSVRVWWDDATRSFRTEAPQSSVRRVVDGLAVVVDESRTSQLRCIGNGVVPLCAATAIVELLRRAGIA